MGLLSWFYNLNSTLLKNHIKNLSRGLDFYSSKNDSFIVLKNLMLKLETPLLYF